MFSNAIILLVKAGYVQFYLSAWGIPWTAPKGSGYHNYTWFKAHKVRTEASNSCSLLLKDCDEKITTDRNPWGKPRRTHKNK